MDGSSPGDRDGAVGSDGAASASDGAMSSDGAAASGDGAIGDAFVPEPRCVPEASGAPGELLCTGLTPPSGAILRATAMVPGRGEIVLPIFEDAEDVWLTVPWVPSADCRTTGATTPDGSPFAGMLTVSVTADDAPLGTIELAIETLEPWTVGEPGSVLRGALARDLDVLRAADPSDTEAAELAVDVEQLIDLIDRAAVGPVTLGSQRAACIPANVCDCRNMEIGPTELRWLDAYLQNVASTVPDSGALRPRAFGFRQCLTGTIGELVGCAVVAGIVGEIAIATGVVVAASATPFIVGTVMVGLATRALARTAVGMRIVGSVTAYLDRLRSEVILTARQITLVFHPLDLLQVALSENIPDDEFPCEVCVRGLTQQEQSDLLAACQSLGPDIYPYPGPGGCFCTSEQAGCYSSFGGVCPYPDPETVTAWEAVCRTVGLVALDRPCPDRCYP